MELQQKEDNIPEKKSPLKIQSLTGANNDKVNSLVNETKLEKSSKKKNIVKDTIVEKENGEETALVNFFNGNEIKSIDEKNFLPLENTQSLILEKKFQSPIVVSPYSSNILVSDNQQIQEEKNIEKKVNVKENIENKTSAKLSNDKIEKNNDITKTINCTEKIQQNINNKHFGIKDNIVNKINNKIENTNKENGFLPFYTFTNSCRIYADMISPKSLIKIDNYNNYGKKDLNKEPYYVGVMNSTIANKIQIEEDEFFLRKVEFKCESIYFISIYYNSRLRHYLILRTTKENLFYIKKYCFHTVQELIRFHLEQRVPIKNDVFLYSWITTFSWHRQHNEIQLIRKIGSNAFSQIFIGNLEGGSFGKILNVAVKIFTSSKEKLNSKQKSQFISDANVIINLKSKYIIKLIGICIRKEPFVAILEYASKGSLLKLLKRMEVTEKQKHNYCLHIACAIKYLHDNFILHRNISTKSVLVGGDDIAKLYDLGFVFHSSNKDKKKKKKFSLRWTAPETIENGEYTFKSESWSYGIFISEVYNDGEKPFSSIKNWKVLVSLILKNKAKDNLNIKKLPDDLNNILSMCLNLISKNRPNFDEIIKLIEVGKIPLQEVVKNWITNFYNKYFVFSNRNQSLYSKDLYRKKIYESLANNSIENNNEISMINSSLKF
uniref:Non-specific protein-tyrosine kinase n=1 Tax=Strongyloides stercoralis TaxID=6248 RepID=A0A0K0DX52_STRER